MQRKFTVILAGAVLLMALVAIWWQVRPAHPKFDRTPVIGTGQVLADETLRAINERGRIVVVVVGSAARPVMPGNGLWEGFRDVLKQRPSVSIVATEFIAGDAMGLPSCTAAALADVWSRHAEVDALVFFTGLPNWVDMSAQLRQRASPKIIVVDTAAPPSKLRYGGYFANGILTVLIGIRTEPPPVSTAQPNTPREVFQQHHQVYTPDNYGTMPD